MLYRILADLVVVLHLLFVGFVVLGGLLVLRWPRLAWLHLPVVAWGIGIEWLGGVCPLTPLEKQLRALGGEAGYAGGFIEHYLLPILYPAGMTRTIQLVLGAIVLLVNVFVYAVLLRRHHLARAPRPAAAKQDPAKGGNGQEG